MPLELLLFPTIILLVADLQAYHRLHVEFKRLQRSNAEQLQALHERLNYLERRLASQEDSVSPAPAMQQPLSSSPHAAPVSPLTQGIHCTFAILFFILFAEIILIFHCLHRQNISTMELFLQGLNAACFTLSLLPRLHFEHGPLRAGTTAALTGCYHLEHWQLTRKCRPQDRRLQSSTCCMASIMLLLGLYLASPLNGRPMALSIAAVPIFIWGLRLNCASLLMTAYGALIVCLPHMLSTRFIAMNQSAAPFPIRLATFAIYAAAAATMAHLHAKQRDMPSPHTRQDASILRLTALASIVICAFSETTCLARNCELAVNPWTHLRILILPLAIACMAQITSRPPTSLPCEHCPVPFRI